ncbi:MAG: hypothetical protein JXA60_00210 [Candidatus Coatesbacteria bacterium]|nr:hypothetical protein [Candidatus Coatesbacteria bacterium]
MQEIREIFISEESFSSRISNSLRRRTDSWKVITEDEAEKLKAGYGRILIKSRKGDFVKRCPCTQSPYISCCYYNINLVEGCHQDCRYCILPDYLSDKPLTIYSNMDLLLEELNDFHASLNAPIRIGTGELGDSLLYEKTIGHNDLLIPLLNDFSNFILELKTKTLETLSLKKYWKNNNIVWAWSVNTEYVSGKLEGKCASTKDRIALAKEISENGGKVAFHFDPVCPYKDALRDYRDLVDLIFSQIKRERISWISLGVLRFPGSQKVFSDSLIEFISNEYINGEDGKLRLLKTLRKRFLKSISERIYEFDENAMLYLCMEPYDVWEHVLAGKPEDIKNAIFHGGRIA